MSEASAKFKISNPIPPLEPFPFEELPEIENANLWSLIRTQYGLSLIELVALQKARSSEEGTKFVLQTKILLFHSIILLIYFTVFPSILLYFYLLLMVVY
jgi:hypothetical protein